MGAKYDIVGGIVSDAAMKQLQEIEKLATSIGKSLQGVKLSDISKGGKDAANLEKLNAQTQLLIEKTKLLEQQREKAASKRITETNDELKAMRSYYSELEKSSAKEAAAATKAADEKRRAQEAVAAANEKARKTTADYKIGVSALSNVEKLKAVITSEHTSALQKLDAQIRLNVLDAQKYVAAGDTQNANYLKLIANTKQLSAEYDRMAKASGSNMVKTQSMYGATFQLTQVMRELPNFAIDARIGFMALSNNLPMLIDSFKNLSQQIDVTTGKAYGNMGALKQFGKSLLSLNTIMIIASTLLVLFGDDIVKFGEKLFASDKIINKASESIKALIAVTRDYSGSAASSISSIQQLGIEIEKYGSNAKYADTIVEKFNDTFNTHLTSVDQVKAAYPQMAQAAIEAAVKTQAAMSLIQRSSTALLQKMEADQKLSGYKKSTLAPYEDMVNRLFGIADEEGLDKNEITTRLTEGKSPFDSFLGQNVFKKEENRDIAEWFENPNNLWFAKYIAQQRKANKVMELLNKEAAKLIQPPKVDTDNPNNPNNTTYRDKGVDMDYLTYKQPRPETITTKGIKMPAMASIFNIDAAAIDKVLADTIKKYENGLISFEEYEAEKNRLIQQAADLGVFITEDNYDKIDKITQERLAEIVDKENEILSDKLDKQQAFYEISMELLNSYYERYNEKLEKESKRQAKIEEEKYKDIEDREKAGVLTKQEAEEEKARTQTYYDSVQEELDRKKAEKEKESFLISQGLAIADIWIKLGQTIASYTAAEAAQSILIGPAAVGIYEPLKAKALFQAGASTALILAQSIPAFEQGGVVAKDGTILAGEKRHELAILPDGSFFVTANKPTLYDVPKGTEIMPDLNKIDIMDILHLKPLYANHSDNKQTDALLRKIDNSIRNQKQGNFYGMPLIKQLDSRGRFDSRRKSLMN